MSTPSGLPAAEIKLLKARRTCAGKLLRLRAVHLHHRHPEAVRLTVYEGPLEKLLRTERCTGEHYLDLTRVG